MPRNLGSEDGPVALSESPHSTEGFEDQDSNGKFIIVTDHLEQPNKRQDSLGKLHPYTRLLTISDLESCVALENAAFPVEQERASREKTLYICLRGSNHGRRPRFVSTLDLIWEWTLVLFPLREIPSLHMQEEKTGFVPAAMAIATVTLEPADSFILASQFMYRLSKCPELSLGIFCTALPDSNIPAETLQTGRPIESSRENGAVGVLLAHVVATQSFDTVVTDAAMDYPADWNSAQSSTVTVGHRDGGRTICVHSLGVLPSFQSRGLGRTLMTAYMQQMNGAGIADRIALIAHEHLVGYYEKLGFTSKGPSKSQFGGGGWIDLVFELKSIDARAKYG